MKEDLLKIIEHYGVMNQCKKLNEECYELLEAINNYEWYKDEYGRCDTNSIEEEFADVMVLLGQIKEYYNLDSEKIKNIMEQKVDRQLNRIKGE